MGIPDRRPVRREPAGRERKGEKMAKSSAQSSPGGVAAVCRRLAQPVAEELGLLLWDVRFLKEGASWILRVFIDREDGDVSIDDCVAVSRRMDKLLDEADPIPQAYCLEVSSPGIGRELTRPEHFERFEGFPVEVRLIRPIDGVRDFAGLLAGFSDGAVTIRTGEDEVLTFQKKETASVRLSEDWDDGDNGGETENE